MSERDREEAEERRVVAEGERVQAEEDRVDAEAGNGGSALEESRVVAEQARVDAEKVREVHEKHRRINEGGVDQHVPGNTKTGRVEAEHARQSERTKMYRRVSALVALPIAFIVLIPMAGMIYAVNNRAVSAERKARIVASDAAQKIQERAYGGQLAACDRGNVLRRQMNANSEIILDFALTAAGASMERSRQFRSDGNTEQADINLRASKKFTRYAKALKTIPHVDCLSVIPKP